MSGTEIPLEKIAELKGTSLGVTEWKHIEQSIIDAFAEATGDKQWIHVDIVRAAKESPFRKKTIAHGYFTLALVPAFFWELLTVTGTRLIVNTATNSVRWPAPVPIPSRVRMAAKIVDVQKLENCADLVVEATIEVENQQRPGMIAEVVYRYYSK